jgi:hypothetical protein
MKEKDITARQAALNTRLKGDILTKLESIKENIVLEKGSNSNSYFQMLMMIDEELDDVLLNWDCDSINPRLSFLDSDDLDDEDDD